MDRLTDGQTDGQSACETATDSQSVDRRCYSRGGVETMTDSCRKNKRVGRRTDRQTDGRG